MTTCARCPRTLIPQRTWADATPTQRNTWLTDGSSVHQAHGLCRPCYLKTYRAEKGTGPARPGRVTIDFPDLPDAACTLIADAEVFFPAAGSRGQAARRRAVGICGDCPAATRCLEWAMTNDVKGIWGGTTERERRTWQRQQRQGVA